MWHSCLQEINITLVMFLRCVCISVKCGNNECGERERGEKELASNLVHTKTGWSVWGITGGSSRLSGEITHRLRGIYGMYPEIKKPQPKDHNTDPVGLGKITGILTDYCPKISPGNVHQTHIGLHSFTSCSKMDILRHFLGAASMLVWST